MELLDVLVKYKTAPDLEYPGDLVLVAQHQAEDERGYGSADLNVLGSGVEHQERCDRYHEGEGLALKTFQNCEPEYPEEEGDEPGKNEGAEKVLDEHSGLCVPALQYLDEYQGRHNAKHVGDD